jgi:hypothetical protein
MFRTVHYHMSSKKHQQNALVLCISFHAPACFAPIGPSSGCLLLQSTRWSKYDRDDLCVNKSQFVPVIFEPPCTLLSKCAGPIYKYGVRAECMLCVNMLEFTYVKMSDMPCVSVCVLFAAVHVETHSNSEQHAHRHAGHIRHFNIREF